MYLYAADSTKETAQRRLRMFLDFARIEGSELRERCNTFALKAKKNAGWCEDIVYSYLSHLKEQYENEKKISAGTIKNRKVIVKNLLEILKIPFDWKLLSRGLPKPEKYSNDRAPTIEELRIMCEYNDRRIKPIIYTMCSSGIRIGAWDYLKWKHITPVKRNGKVVAAIMDVYADTDAQYPTLITNEAYDSLNAWMNFRKKSGEKITEDSWLMRHYWDTKEGFTHGSINKPTRLTKDGVKALIDSALRRQGLRKNLEKGKKRHDLKLNHSFRKWRETQLILAGLKQQDINILMGHENAGMIDHYYRPWINGQQKIDDYLIDEFLKASDHLSIQREYKLQNKLQSLEDKQNEISLMKSKHEKEMHEMRKKLSTLHNLFVRISK